MSQKKSARLRFIIDGAMSAKFNMTVDRYLLESCGAQNENADNVDNANNVVTVRFYFWEQPTITLGCMQNAESELDLARAEQDGVEWIKRPTGGRAVLHDGDLTYSCAFSKSAAMGNTISQTYRLISECLMRGLALASITCSPHDSDLDVRGIGRDAKLPCFLAPNRNEIMSGNKKLFGSAQKRSAHAVLQHGSIPITNAFRNLPKYLRIDDDEKTRQEKLLFDKCACVNELSNEITSELLIENLIKGFREILSLESEVIPWMTSEKEFIYNMMSDD